MPVDHHCLEMVMPRTGMSYEPDIFVVATLQRLELPVEIVDPPFDVPAARLTLTHCQPEASASLRECRDQRRAALQLGLEVLGLRAVQYQPRPKFSAQARTEISQRPGDTGNQQISHYVNRRHALNTAT
jgi:hypothetical protein